MQIVVEEFYSPSMELSLESRSGNRIWLQTQKPWPGQSQKVTCEIELWLRTYWCGLRFGSVSIFL